MSATTTTRRKAQPRSKAKGTSQRQTEANQRNALKSSGPRTAEGKNRSRHNAVTHGLTAESTILPGEDASAFQARRQEIVDGMQPCNQVEAILLEQIARCEWKSMRADRAASARLSAQLRDEYDATNFNDKDGVIELGQHLLSHPPYPLPVSSPNDKGYLGKAPLADVPGDPHHPARLVLKLEQTVRGCDWLLGRWAGLKLRLDIEGLWLMAEGYEMIRLMGKYVIDMASDFQVEMLMLASRCVAVDGKSENDAKGTEETQPKSFFDSPDESDAPFQWRSERMNTFCGPWARALAKRPLDRLMPENVAEARQWLTVAIDDEVKRLTMIRAHRQQFADLDWSEAPARMAFETGTEGDRLRRYDLSRDRVLIRAIGKFVEVRNASIAGTFNLLDYDLDELKECDHPSDPNAGTHADPIGDSSESGDGQAEVAGPANDEAVRAGVDNETAGDWIWDQVAKLAPIRAEDLRKLNEECRNEGQDIKAAARRSRRVANKNGTRASDQVQSEEPPTMVAGVCDPGVPTTPANVAAVCDPDLPGTAGLTEAGYNEGPIAAQTEKPEGYPKTGDLEICFGSQKPLAASPSFNSGCDDDQILRNEPIEFVAVPTMGKEGDYSGAAVSDETVTNRARAERIKAERFALWKQQKLKRMREAERRPERPPP